MEPNYELEDTLFEEPILWKYSPTKYRKLSNELLYASIVPAACLLAGVILALTDIILWIGLLMFGGTAVITFLIIIGIPFAIITNFIGIRDKLILSQSAGL